MTKQKPTILNPPERLPNESKRDYERRFIAFILGEDVCSKTDLRSWTGSLPFHLDVPDSNKR